MSRRIFVSFIVCAIGLGQLLRLPSVSAAAAINSHLRTILEEGWSHAIEGPKVVEQVLKQAQQHGEGSAFLYYACGVALVKHYRYQDAMNLFDTAAQSAPHYLPARKARVWLQVRAELHTEALAELEQLAGIVGHSEQESAAAETCVSLIGTLIGYMEGPGRVNDGLLESTKSTIVERLAPDQVAIYEHARSRVRERYAALIATIKRTQQEALELEKKQKTEARQEIAAQINDVREERQEAQSGLDQLKTSFESQMKDLQRQYDVLDAECAGWQTQANSVHRSIHDTERDIEDLEELRDAAVKDKNVPLAEMYQRSIDRRNRDLARLSSRHAALEGMTDVARRAANAVAAQRRLAIRQYDRDKNQLVKTLKLLDRRVKRLLADQREADKPATGNTREVGELRLRASFLGTYVRFNTEAERQRLLRLVDRQNTFTRAVDAR